MLKIGVDCENIARFRRLPYAKSEFFYKRVFTPREIKYCVSCREPYHRFAVRFAAKEAVIKALSGIARPYYRDIEVRKEKSGAPRIHINSKKFSETKSLDILLSLAHSKTHAVAFVIATDQKREKSKLRRALRETAPFIKKNFGG
ncbi:MAG: holo-ACP synthase [Candidatus Omnitrophota bacterium]